MTVTYLPRSDWDNSGAPRSGYVVPPRQFVGLAIHHTVTLHAPAPGLGDEINHMRYLRTIRPDLGLDVPYSGVVFRGAGLYDAVLAEGRGPGRTGAHTYGFNSTRYGIAYAGNSGTDPMTPGVLEAIRLAGRLWCPWATAPTLGHQQFEGLEGTACPGSWLLAHLDELQPPFDTFAPASTPEPTPDGEDPDMAATMRQYRTPDGKIWAVHGLTRKHIPDLSTRDLLVARGLLAAEVVECGNNWDLDFLEDITPSG